MIEKNRDKKLHSKRKDTIKDELIGKITHAYDAYNNAKVFIYIHIKTES